MHSEVAWSTWRIKSLLALRDACNVLTSIVYSVCTIFQTGFSIKQTGLLHHAYISQRIFVGKACTNNAKTNRVCRKHSLSTSLDSYCSYIRLNFKKQDNEINKRNKNISIKKILNDVKDNFESYCFSEVVYAYECNMHRNFEMRYKKEHIKKLMKRIYYLKIQNSNNIYFPVLIFICVCNTRNSAFF